MITTYYLEESELNDEFLAGVKKLFKKKKLAITISEEMDETEYLLASEANRRRLLASIENIQKGEKLLAADIDKLQNELLSENS